LKIVDVQLLLFCNVLTQALAMDVPMTPRMRFLNALRGAPVDRVPLLLQGFANWAPRKRFGDPGKQEIFERVGHEMPAFLEFSTHVNRYLVTPGSAFEEVSREQQEDGGEVTTVRINTPKGPLTAITGRNNISKTRWTVKYPVETMGDIEKIRSVPWVRPPALAPPDLSDLPPAFWERGIIRIGVSSPFVCVAGMMPYEFFLELCFTDLPLLKELTRICLARILDILGVVLAEKTVEYVWMGGSEWVTPPMGSPEHYDALVQEAEATIIERIHAAGALSHVHCHGNVRSTIGKVVQRGADYFEPVEPPPDGDITMAEAKGIVAGRMTLGGNIESRILENEDTGTVEAATRAAFEGGKQRMVLETTAGPIARMTKRSVANYHRMLDVWEELSPV
jgi:hypothetical protein